MKRYIIITTLVFGTFIFATGSLQAQANATTTVNINLNDIISIEDESVASDGVVDFNFLTAEDYNNGITVIVNNSLVVTSTTTFDISVKANGSHFGLSGLNGIPIEILSITRASTSTPNPMTGSTSPIVLSTSNQKLISNATFGSKKTLDIEYEIPGSQSIAHLFGRTAGAYTQTITYTATAL